MLTSMCNKCAKLRLMPNTKRNFLTIDFLFKSQLLTFMCNKIDIPLWEKNVLTYTTKKSKCFFQWVVAFFVSIRNNWSSGWCQKKGSIFRKLHLWFQLLQVSGKHSSWNCRSYKTVDSRTQFYCFHIPEWASQE